MHSFATLSLLTFAKYCCNHYVTINIINERVLKRRALIQQNTHYAIMHYSRFGINKRIAAREHVLQRQKRRRRL